VLDVKLTNTGDVPAYVDPAIFLRNDTLRLAIRPQHGRAVAWRPYVTRCLLSEPRLLLPGQWIEASAFVSAGVGGWYLADPGAYRLEARIDTEHGAVVAAPLDLRIAVPRRREEELAAQDFFTDEVGRALALGGTRVVGRAIESLTEVTERLGESAAARHAALALALPLMRRSRVLSLPEGRAPMASVAAAGGRFKARAADPGTARRLLEAALRDDDGLASATFGRRTLARHRAMYEKWLRDPDDHESVGGERPKRTRARKRQ
jgi:hypothetical protein